MCAWTLQAPPESYPRRPIHNQSTALLKLGVQVVNGPVESIQIDAPRNARHRAPRRVLPEGPARLSRPRPRTELLN
jgi:hypothetical protein